MALSSKIEGIVEDRRWGRCGTTQTPFVSWDLRPESGHVGPGCDSLGTGPPSALAKPSWLLTLLKGHWGLRVTCQDHRKGFGGLFYYPRPTGSPVIRLAWDFLTHFPAPTSQVPEL